MVGSAAEAHGENVQKFALLVSLVILVTHGAARAADPELEGYGRTGIYLGLAGSYAIETFDDLGLPVPVDNSLGLSLRVGYRLLSRLGLEVQAEWAEGFDVKGTGIEIETWAVTANARAYFTDARVQPYLLLGFGLMHASARFPLGLGTETGTGFAARVGGGVDVGITDQIALVLEGTYVGATGPLSDLGYGSIVWGLQYRF